ncbi:MAG: histidine kinase [Chitinophagales bacterium]
MAESLIRTNRFLTTFGIWWLAWATAQVLILQYLDFSLRTAIIDSLVNNGLLALSCLFIVYIMQFYLPQKEKYWYAVAISILASGIDIALFHFLAPRFDDNEQYAAFVTASWPVRSGFAFLMSGCMALISIIYYTVEEQKESDKRKHDAEKLAREAELFNLRQQLQPHFLFNSLNSISALAGSKPEAARSMIQQLSDFLRGTVRRDNNSINTLAEELRHLQLYLDIEKVRFGHRLQTQVICDDALKNIRIPALILQPVVENAIKFGLYDTLDTVLVEIIAEQKDNMLYLMVRNPFDSSNLPQSGTGFGLSSLRRRLYLLYARNDLMTTQAEDNIFTTTIKIPLA